MNGKPTSLRFENLDLTMSAQGAMRIELPRTTAQAELDLIFQWISHQTRAQLVRKTRGSYILVPGFLASFGGTRIRDVILELEASGATYVDFSKTHIAMLLTPDKKRITIIEPRRPGV